LVIAYWLLPIASCAQQEDAAKKTAEAAEPKKDDEKATTELILPPQCYHIDFDDDLKMKEFGFYTVDRRQGNTGGLGGAFGYMYGVGRPLPIPECQPYKRSLRFRLLSFVGGLAQKFSKKKKE